VTPLSRALAGALLVVSVLVLTAGPAAADSVGLTYDQWRTGRLVFGVIGLTLMGFVAFGAVRAWWSRRRTTDQG
jgi:hypothetical protein